MGRGMGMGLGMGMGMGMGFKRRRSAGTVGQAYAAGLPGDEEPRMFRAKVKLVLRRHASFIGPGIVASVAYADPVSFGDECAHRAWDLIRLWWWVDGAGILDSES